MGKAKHRIGFTRGIPNRFRPRYDVVRISNLAYKPIFTVKASFGHLNFFGRGFHMRSAKRAALMDAQRFGLINMTYIGMTKPFQDRPVARQLIYLTGNTNKGIVNRTPACVKGVCAVSDKKSQMPTQIDIDKKYELPEEMVCNSKQISEMQHDVNLCHNIGLPKPHVDDYDANLPNARDVNNDTCHVEQLDGDLKISIPQPSVGNFDISLQKSPDNDFQEHPKMLFSDGFGIPKAAPNDLAEHKINENVIDSKPCFQKEEPVEVCSKTERSEHTMGEDYIDVSRCLPKVETVDANEIIECSKQTVVEDVIDLTQSIPNVETVGAGRLVEYSEDTIVDDVIDLIQSVQNVETVDANSLVKCSEQTTVEDVIDLIQSIPNVETVGAGRLVKSSEHTIVEDVIDLIQSIPNVETVGAGRQVKSSEHTTVDDVIDLTQSIPKSESDDAYEIIEDNKDIDVICVSEDNDDDYLDLTVGYPGDFTEKTACLPIDQFLDSKSDLQNDGSNETEDDNFLDLNDLAVEISIPENDNKQTLALLAEDFTDLKIGFPRPSDDLSKQSVETVEMLVDGITDLTIEP